MKKKRTLSIYMLPGVVLLVLLMVFVGITLAFYSSTGKIDNKLLTTRSEVYLIELFDPDDLWLPGETKEKLVSFGNQHNIDQVIRFKVRTEWVNADGSPWIYTGNYVPDSIVINWTEEISGDEDATWIKIDEHYYYKAILLRQYGANPTELPPVISSVTFNDELSNDISHADDFSNKTCRLYIEMETVDVNPDITEAAWNVTFKQDGNSLKWDAT